MAMVHQTALSATILSEHKLSPKTFVEEDSYEGKLRRFRDSRSLAQGKLIHAHVLENGSEKGRFLGNLLMEMYSACGSVEYAAIAFDHIHRRNAFSWNAIIGAYARNEHSLEVFLLFQQMLLEDVVPDKYTFGIILTACSNLSAFSEGIINMYGKCGSLEDALKVFLGMKERDAVSWNAMIGAYNLNGHSKEAFEVFHNMAQEGSNQPWHWKMH